MAVHKPMHGTTKSRGCDHLRLGHFCKLFPKLPTWAEECKITDRCEAERIAAVLGGPGGIMHDAASSSQDSELCSASTSLRRSDTKLRRAYQALLGLA